jgi:hypothetical protein
MTRVANSMTEKFVVSKICQDKRMERMQLEGNTTTYYVSVCTLPESGNGISAGAFVNGSNIQSNKAHIEQIMNWFEDNPSPSNTP